MNRNRKTRLSARRSVSATNGESGDIDTQGKNSMVTALFVRGTDGFSLIELIVVLVIMGLLAGVVGPAVVDKVKGARAKIAKLQIAEIEKVLESYHFDIGRYPTTSEGLAALIQNPGSNSSWSGPYLKKGVPKDPWNKEYVYRSPGQHGDYDLYSLGADGVEGGSGTDADVVSWSQ